MRLETLAIRDGRVSRHPRWIGQLLVFVSGVPCMGCPKLPELRRAGLSGFVLLPRETVYQYMRHAKLE